MKTFIQWKNTDLCMDFWCECGQQSHFDGYFAYALRCPSCKKIFEMPTDVASMLIEMSDAYDGSILNPTHYVVDDKYTTDYRW